MEVLSSNRPMVIVIITMEIKLTFIITAIGVKVIIAVIVMKVEASLIVRMMMIPAQQ